MSGWIDQLVEEKRIIISCGSGGVGKTTASAAIGIAAAQAGQRVLVLTIDPAKRLANSLGLEALDNDPRKIDSALFEKQGLRLEGELWSMMLDVKHTFDHIVKKYSTREESADRILNNRFYQYLSDAMAGTQEYMAVERLYELATEEDYDLIVLDTPPTQHALDFLDSPDRIIKFLETGAIKLFLSPTLRAGKTGARALKKGADAVSGLLQKLTGGELLADFAEFFGAFEEMTEGFGERSSAVKALLSDSETAFILVTSPSPVNIREANFFYEKINAFGMPFGGFVVNRVHTLQHLTGKEDPSWLHDAESDGMDPDALAETLGEGAEADGDLLATLIDRFRKFRSMAIQDREEIAKLVRIAPGRVSRIPYFETDINDLKGLDRLNGYLLGRT